MATGQRGTERFRHVDTSGAEWDVQVTWTALGGRVEATGLAVDSEGRAPLSGAVLRRIEAEVRERRQERAIKVARLVQAGGDVGRRAARQVPEYAAPPEAERRRPGPRRDDAAWRARAEAVAQAWAERRPLLAALEQLEPGLTHHAYRQRLRRLYVWDATYGDGLLAEVGRRGEREAGEP